MKANITPAPSTTKGMTKEDIEAIVTELLNSGDFGLELDEKEVASMVTKINLGLVKRVDAIGASVADLQTEVASLKAWRNQQFSGRIDPTAVKKTPAPAPTPMVSVQKKAA